MIARYVVRRLTQVLPAVAGILVVGFLLVQLAPGDPVLALAGEHGDAEYYALMRDKFGLDEPLWVQLGAFASNAIQGDFGISYTHGRPALDVIGERVGATLLLAGTALFISTVLGIGAGTVAAMRSGGVTDTAVTAVSLSLYAAPVFWIGQLALVVFALWLDIAPSHGMASPNPPADLTGRAVDLVRHLALPALVLASQEVASVTRLTRIGLIEELDTDHVRTARAKGVKEWAVVLRHAMRRALGPVTTVVGARIGYLFSGAVVVEVVFGWPGIGRLLLAAMQTRDAPILLGIFFLVAVSVVVANLITDLAYGRLDPRILYR